MTGRARFDFRMGLWENCVKTKGMKIQGRYTCTCTHTQAVHLWTLDYWQYFELRMMTSPPELFCCVWFVFSFRITWCRLRKLFSFAPFCSSTLPTVSLHDFVLKHFMLGEKKNVVRTTYVVYVRSAQPWQAAVTYSCLCLCKGICWEIMVPFWSLGSSDGVNRTFTHTVCKEARGSAADCGALMWQYIHSVFLSSPCHILLMNIILLREKVWSFNAE